jgi:eukaryotic-like serine/threonine-protein kinase
MIYCINPQCHSRQNPDSALTCGSCGTPLLVCDRYRLIQPLRPLHYHGYTEIFEVQDDRDHQDGDRLKVLKVLIQDHPQLISLFQQETDLLMKNLRHPGIPQGEDAFQWGVPATGQKLRCLVMERVVGQNLEQWSHQHGPITEAQALDWLKELAEILRFIHDHQLFHRDIKPSNIMRRPDGQLVLIDFGTARQVSQTVVNGQAMTIIYSDGFTAPEQLAGRAVPQSDFHALGRTLVHLLTGKHPVAIGENLPHWQQGLSLSAPFVKFINRLMAESPQQRPQAPQEILTAVQAMQRSTRVTQRSTPRVAWVGIFLLGAIAGGGLNYLLTHRPVVSLPPACNSTLGDNLSCGEEILMPGAALAEKQAGVEAWKARDYAKAASLLQQAWEKGGQEPDPETLIYWNNAKLAVRGTEASTLAAIVPLPNTSMRTFRRGKEMLAGFAQAQTEAIEAGVPIKLLLGNDANQEEQAAAIANLIVQRQILAVLGHHSSEATLQALPTYQKHQRVVISPTSTSVDLSGKSFFWRTVPTTRQAAEALVKHLRQTTPPPQMIAAFYNPKSNFSQSSWQEFKQLWSAQGGQVIETPQTNLANPEFKPEMAIVGVKQAGAQVLALFPDGHTDPYAFPNALEIVRENRGQLPIVGVNPFYDPETLKRMTPSALNNFVISVPWFRDDASSRQFNDGARRTWRGPVSWRAAFAYDALKVITTVLQRNPNLNSTQLLQSLTDPQFAATGAAGKISFKGSDRQENPTTLVKVAPQCAKPDAYSFVGLDQVGCANE